MKKLCGKSPSLKMSYSIATIFTDDWDLSLFRLTEWNDFEAEPALPVVDCVGESSRKNCSGYHFGKLRRGPSVQ